MDTDSKKRALRLFKEIASVVLLGAAYYIFITLTGLAIPCLIKLATGKFCPGCGVTRMAVALLHFDLKTAFRSNMLVMILLPFMAVSGIYKSYHYIKNGKVPRKKIDDIAVALATAALIVFAVLRNTETFAFLQP